MINTKWKIIVFSKFSLALERVKIKFVSFLYKHNVSFIFIKK